MLNYSDEDITAKNIAIFYAKKINSPTAEAFFQGNTSLTNTNEALDVARAFWEITDLASTDHLNNVSAFNDIDLEFWMHKLFNKLYGYYEKNGFKEQWQVAEKEFG
jgi:hypothetical protein